MPLSDLERERRLFTSCLDRSAKERAEYLERECQGDSVLRGRIERLLDAHSRTAPRGLLNIPIDDIPDQIGRYQLIRVIGEGGMGTVYEAEQQEPINRSVALKIVKLGGSAKAASGILSRFTAERQALAVMDHPNVAKVFDAGETLLGHPYFVMELVKGGPITEYCDQRALPIQERLRIFIQLCHAVQHAHQKGVIHRDLKPSNALVTDESGEPLAKVIDFGVAKAMGDHIASATQTGFPVGTPAYMSPEQAAAGTADIDTRTDIYSLGVILYELLTAALPADPAESGYAGFLARLAIGDLKISLPSARFASATEEIQQAAERRSSTPRNLARTIEGDLDQIVMRALETDRSRRYSSAGAFADDVERFLNHEPVTARRPTMAYRLSKFIRRHRFQAVAAGIASIALLGGAIASTIGYLRASRAEALAREEAATARQVSSFLSELFSIPDPNRAPGSAVSAVELLDRGARKVESELGNRPRVQVDLLATLSHVYESTGQYQRAGDLARKALAVSRNAKLDDDLKTAEALLTLGRVEQRMGRFNESRKALERALEIRTRLDGEDSLQASVILNNLGALYGQLEEFDNAIAAHQRALAIQLKKGGQGHITTYNSLRGMGMVHDRKGEWQAALDSFRAALVVTEKRYGPDHQAVTDGLNNIARMLLRLNQPAETRKLYERSLAIQKRQLGSDHPDLAFTYHGLGKVLTQLGDLKEALAALQEGLRIREARLGPDNVRTADLLSTLGEVRMRLGETEQARQLLQRTFDIYRRVYGPVHSQTLENQRNLALSLVAAKRYDDAIPHLRDLLQREQRPGLRIDLNDPMFDPIRTTPRFRELRSQNAQ